MDFDTYLKEQLKKPKFKKELKEERKKTELEVEFNEILQKRGYKNLCVEVLAMDEY